MPVSVATCVTVRKPLLQSRGGSSLTAFTARRGDSGDDQKTAVARSTDC
jgi:hypothetical protein